MEKENVEIKIVSSKENEEHINVLKGEVKNENMEKTNSKSANKPAGVKLNKKFVNILKENERLSEEDICSKFKDSETLHQYIKEKGYKEKRKPRKKETVIDNNISKLNKIKDIVNSEISDAEKIKKLHDIFEEDNRIVELKKELNKKEKEHKTCSSKIAKMQDVLNKLDEEIKKLKNNIEGN